MSTRSLLLGVLVLSVVLRISSSVYQGADIGQLPGVTDEVSYHGLAVRVLDGHGFSFPTGWWPATRANQPTAHWSYAYVLFLTAVYGVAGPVPLVARLIQAVFVGIVHPLLVWRIGRRVFSPAVGLAAAAVTALYGYFVFYAGALVTESLFFVAVLWVLDVATAFVCAYRAGHANRWSPWVWLGIACGAAVLLRQAFLLLVPAVLAWIAWQVIQSRDARRGGPGTARVLAGGLAATVVVIGLFILPWTVRNYRAFGEFALLNTNAGFAFFWGNHPVHGTTFIPILPNGPVNYMTLLPRELESLNEAQLDRALLQRGLAFVIDDPGRYVRLSVSRATEYFKFWPSADSGTVSNLVRVLSFGVVLPFLVFGVARALMTMRRPWSQGTLTMPDGAALLLGVAGLYALVHLLTWTLVRYRLPVDAVLMPFVGLALVSLYQHLFRRTSGLDVDRSLSPQLRELT